MSIKLKLEIEIDEESNMVKVTTSEGETYYLKSLNCFGGDAERKEVFIRQYGSSADSAWAYAEGFKQAESASGTKSAKNFYKQCAAHICQALDPDAFRQMIEASNLENKWDCEDQRKWAGWDSEDVLADKQISEARKKFFN